VTHEEQVGLIEAHHSITPAGEALGVGLDQRAERAKGRRETGREDNVVKSTGGIVRVART